MSELDSGTTVVGDETNPADAAQTVESTPEPIEAVEEAPALTTTDPEEDDDDGYNASRLSEAVQKRAEARASKTEESEDFDELEAPADRPKPHEPSPPEPKKADEAAEEPAETDLEPEEVDERYAKDSPTARSKIKELAAAKRELSSRVTELETEIDVFGGKEGLTAMAEKVALLEDPTRIDELFEVLSKGPLSKDIQTKYFWETLDNDAVKDMVVQDLFGEEYTYNDVVRVFDLYVKGLIDPDEIALKADSFRLSDAELDAKKTEMAELERLRSENAELRKIREAKQQQLEQSRIAEAWMGVAEQYNADLFQLLENTGLEPRRDDSPEVQELKNRTWNTISANCERAYQDHPEYKRISEMIQRGATDTITFRNAVRGFKHFYIDTAAAEIKKELPFLNAQIVALQGLIQNQQTADTQPRTAAAAAGTGEAPQADTTTTTQRLATAQPTDADEGFRDEEARVNAFERAVHRSARSRRG